MPERNSVTWAPFCLLVKDKVINAREKTSSYFTLILTYHLIWYYTAHLTIVCSLAIMDYIADCRTKWLLQDTSLHIDIIEDYSVKSEESNRMAITKKIYNKISIYPASNQLSWARSCMVEAHSGKGASQLKGTW